MTLEQFADRYRILVTRLPESVGRILNQEAHDAVIRMHTHFVPYPGGDRPWLSRQLGKLFRRSGRTEASLRYRVQVERDRATAEFFMTGPGAETQEYGRAFSNRTKNMAIPMGEQLDARGVRRFAGPQAARSAFRLFRRGNALVGTPLGAARGTAARIQFALRRTVPIIARPVVRPERDIAAAHTATRIYAALGRAA